MKNRSGNFLNYRSGCDAAPESLFGSFGSKMAQVRCLKLQTPCLNTVLSSVIRENDFFCRTLYNDVLRRDVAHATIWRIV